MITRAYSKIHEKTKRTSQRPVAHAVFKIELFLQKERLPRNQAEGNGWLIQQKQMDVRGRPH